MARGFSFSLNGKPLAMIARVPKAVLVGMAACVTVVVVLGIAVSGHRPIGLDLPIATWVADRGGDGTVFRVLTHLGASLTVSVLGIAVGLFMFVRRRTPWPLLFV